MNDEQVLNRTWELAMAMLRFAVVGVAILVGGLVALLAAVVGLLATFGGRFGRALAEVLHGAREWAGRLAALLVNALCIVGLAAGLLAGGYWVWRGYGGSWPGVVLALNVVGMPAAVGLMGGLNRGAALLLGLFVAGAAALAVSSPTAAIVLASAFRIGGSYMTWRSLS